MVNVMMRQKLQIRLYDYSLDDKIQSFFNIKADDDDPLGRSFNSTFLINFYAHL